MNCLLFLLLILHLTKTQNSDPVWTWICKNNSCEKIRLQPKSEAVSFAACKIACDPYGNLWPQPTGRVELGGELVAIDPQSTEIIEDQGNKLMRAGYRHFQINLEKLGPNYNGGGVRLVVTINIEDPNQTQLKLSTNESYTLRISELSSDSISANITAPTYFGGRHALETLGQLIIYDDVHNNLKIPSEVYITDGPVYPYRGVLLDTARNYISINTIKRTIDGISASKLNTFHWHITDSQSFPYVSKSNPDLSKLGAYSPRHVYTPENVAEVIEYARERGVRVLPEFDAPAHVGEGWQDTNFVACFNKQPWGEYCVEPPCGQFDPTKPKLYDALEGVYKDMIEQFHPDIFHMGGDEVSISCWNSTPSIVAWMNKQGWGRTEADFMKLWNHFQTQALERFDQQSKDKVPIIMWTSTLTKEEYVEKYLPKDRYIIQIWTTGADPVVKQLANKGYKLILSNYDALYLDCGYASWVSSGTNWCSPYKGWQEIYDNSPSKYGNPDQFLGAEATLWTEQVDDTSVDNRLWPRSAALAERLWSEPSHTWKGAESRMLAHRERLVNRGISADALEPLWCHQNGNECPM